MIPDELKKLQQWVCWGVNPEYPKLPHNPKDLRIQARAGDPTTWGSHQEAEIQRVMGFAKGVGFQFHDNGIVGVDLDNCRDPCTGEVNGWAQRIVNDCDSWTEISLSGKGLHIFIKGRKPGIQCKKVLDESTGEAIEIYENKRYFAMTGDVYHHADIAERQTVLESLYNWLWHEQSIVHMPTEEHTQVLDYYLFVGLERDSKLKDLWNGQRNSTDESGNDQGLMNKLAYWLNRDKEAMIKAFRQSPFAAQKNEEHKMKLLREDYLSRTADGAIAGCGTTAAEDNRVYKQSHSKSTDDENIIHALEVFSLDQLMLEELGELEFYIDGLLHQGLALLSADPKSGKSWLCLDVCLSVASGNQVLGRDTKKCDTLYLALEDGKRRLQTRARMVLEAKGIDSPPKNFYLATAANPVDKGLFEQLEAQLQALPNTKLIVIDVLNRIRSSKGTFGKNAYEIDSAELAKIKTFADAHELCILMIHHNRKSRDSQDAFQNISGSQGLLGAVDLGFMLTKESRMSRKATLSVTSREMEDLELTIEHDRETCVWRDITNEEADSERAEYEDDPIVKTIKALLEEAKDKSWVGSATDILSSGKRLGISIDLDAQAVGYALRKLGEPLHDYDGILYSSLGSGTAPKKHHFYYMPDTGLNEDDDNRDGDDDTE